MYNVLGIQVRLGQVYDIPTIKIFKYIDTKYNIN